MLRLKYFKVKFHSVVLGCLLYRVWLMYYFDFKKVFHKQGKNFIYNKKNKNRASSRSSLDIISVCGSIPIEIPILRTRAVMIGPRPRVLLTLPLPLITLQLHLKHVS
jgi:hypothetical protein